MPTNYLIYGLASLLLAYSCGKTGEPAPTEAISIEIRSDTCVKCIWGGEEYLFIPASLKNNYVRPIKILCFGNNNDWPFRILNAYDVMTVNSLGHRIGMGYYEFGGQMIEIGPQESISGMLNISSFVFFRGRKKIRAFLFTQKIAEKK